MRFGIEDKFSERRRIWFGHVERRDPDYVGKVARGYVPDLKRGQGRPGKTVGQCIKQDLKDLGITREQAQDRLLWRKETRMADPAQPGQMPG